MDRTTGLLNQFNREVATFYGGEEYLVRDNGSVFRKYRYEKRKRKLDETWTFGTESPSNPYLHITGVRVHRIVATAFHGEPDDPKHVVDHIDTNCRNNRPENLRWLSRLENALTNPATRKKIEYLCGSVEAFLENPSMLPQIAGAPNTRWMRTVTEEEARNCKVRMDIWSHSYSKPKNTRGSIQRYNSFEDRVFKPLQKWEVGLGREPGLDMALTPWCAQYMWRASAYFPSCPSHFGHHPVNDYFENLKRGAVLSYSDHDELCPKLVVHEAKLLAAGSSIVVLGRSEKSTWTIVGIERDEKSKHFIHFILGSYSKLAEAQRAFHSKTVSTDFMVEGYENCRR